MTAVSNRRLELADDAPQGSAHVLRGVATLPSPSGIRLRSAHVLRAVDGSSEACTTAEEQRDPLRLLDSTLSGMDAATSTGIGSRTLIAASAIGGLLALAGLLLASMGFWTVVRDPRPHGSIASDPKPLAPAVDPQNHAAPWCGEEPDGQASAASDPPAPRWCGPADPGPGSP